MMLLIFAAVLGATDGGMACPGVEERGDKAMGFSHAMTSHHFSLDRTGGAIFAEATDPADAASRDSIRSHMRHIAQAFSSGDFAMPMFIHGRTPPGVETMRRLKDRISFDVEDTARGARVAIRTADPTALRAIHAFLEFQIEDHHTGDSTAVAG